MQVWCKGGPAGGGSGSGALPLRFRHRRHRRRRRRPSLGRLADPLPLLRDASASERHTLSARKLHLCAFSFDFTDPTAHVREKEMKRQTLLELVDYVNSGSGKFTEAVIRSLPKFWPLKNSHKEVRLALRRRGVCVLG